MASSKRETWTIEPKKWLKDDICSFVADHRIGNRTKGIHAYILDLKETVEKLEERLSQSLNAPSSEKEVVEKAISIKYPDDCYDMLRIESKPNLVECSCPPSLCPVDIPRDKKTGKRIVDNPKKCWRCRGLGYRKVKNTRDKKIQQKPKSHRVFCKRDGTWINYGDRRCLNCTWLPSECPAKRRILKKVRS